MLETFLFPTCFHVSVIPQCQYFFANLEMPSVMNKSTGTFLFETPLLFLFKQVLHVEAAFLSPVCSGHITKSGTDGHQGTLTIRENANGPGSSLNLTIYPFNEVGRSDLIPMLVRKVHVGQSFINPGFYLFCGSSELHFPKLLHHSLCFYTSGILVFPGVDSLEHPVYHRYLSAWDDGKYIAGKVYCATLFRTRSLRLSCIRISFNCIMVSDIVFCLLGILVMVT